MAPARTAPTLNTGNTMKVSAIERKLSRLLPRHQILVTALALAAVSIVGAARLVGQGVGARTPRQVPVCEAAVCDEGAALITALDTLSRNSSECQAGPPVVLRTLHSAPITHLGDVRAGRSGNQLNLPSSPVLSRMEDIGLMSFRRYWDQVRIVDSSEVRSGAVPPTSCLFIFSPLSWLGPDQGRIIVGELRPSIGYFAQRFIFLRRRPGGWRVARVETGLQS
jgi:hypothetical protein